VANGRLILGDNQVPFTPAPYGLLDTATELPQLGRHWQQGLTWEPLCAAGFTTYSRCLVVVRGVSDAEEEPVGPDVPGDEGGPVDPDAKEASTFHQIRGATPFAAVAQIDCSPVAGPERIHRMSAEALTRSEGSQVEATFWTGQAAGQEVVWPHLAADTPLIEPQAGGAVLQPAAEVLNGGTAVGVTTALGLLEEALGDCYDGVGTLHVPRALIPAMADHSLIEARAGLLNTTLGTKVAAGRGYPGTGPDGTETPGVRWVYATGEVFYQRGEIFQPSVVESFDRERNTVRAMAERAYVLGWDCCLLAIPVTVEQEDVS
jgi:hypothetical protein